MIFSQQVTAFIFLHIVWEKNGNTSFGFNRITLSKISNPYKHSLQLSKFGFFSFFAKLHPYASTLMINTNPPSKHF
jgi:uncharacterized protein YpmS